MVSIFKQGGTSKDRIILDKKKYKPTNFPINGSCISCYSIGEMKKCSRCKVTQYYSGVCQNKDWVRHKQLCKLFIHAMKTDLDRP